MPERFTITTAAGARGAFDRPTVQLQLGSIPPQVIEPKAADVPFDPKELTPVTAEEFQEAIAQIDAAVQEARLPTCGPTPRPPRRRRKSHTLLAAILANARSSASPGKVGGRPI